MPLYQLKCKCGHKFEKLTSYFDIAKAKCPLCGSNQCINLPVHKGTFKILGANASNGYFSGDTLHYDPEMNG